MQFYQTICSVCAKDIISGAVKVNDDGTIEKVEEIDNEAIKREGMY